MSQQSIQLYLTRPHDCSYVEKQQATNLVPDPDIPMSMAIYSQLIRLGYRRSGSHTYRPHCEQCQQCIPCRIPTQRFRPRRTQRRCLNRNRDLTLTTTPAHFSDEHFALYSDYLASRHPDGEMVDPEPEDFQNFLYADWSDTDFLELRENGVLRAVAVTDRLNDGLSAVYSFFDPGSAQRGLGNYCILTQIEQARSQGLDYLYLGYWIEQNSKMRYKTNYEPVEVFLNNHWQQL